MIRILLIALVSGILIACNNPTNNEEIELISYNNSLKDDLSILDSIRIVPLETQDSVLLKTPKVFQYVNDRDMFLIMDNQQIVYIFDGSGKFISSSKKCRGYGPKEYQIANDVLYNPYSGNIEIYNPTSGGSIYCYDLNFNWVQNKMINNTEETVAQSFSILSETDYELSPVLLGNKPYITIVKEKDNNVFSTLSLTCPEDNYISEVNMMQKDMTVTDSLIYYTPHYMDYHFYTFDMETHLLHPVYKLDLGEDMVSAESLNDRFGDSNDDKIQNVNRMQQINEYLLSSDYMMPIVRLINDSYVYVHAIKNKKPYHLIYNREIQECYWITPESDMNLHRCLYLHDNVLYTFVRPFELEKYLKGHDKYMSDIMKVKLKEVKEDDNPIIIEYHLKK